MVFEDSSGAIQVYSEEEIAAFEEGGGISVRELERKEVLELVRLQKQSGMACMLCIMVCGSVWIYKTRNYP